MSQQFLAPSDVLTPSQLTQEDTGTSLTASHPISRVTIDRTASNIIKPQYQHKTGAPQRSIHRAAAAVVTTSPKCKKPQPRTATDPQENALQVGCFCDRLHLTAQGTLTVFGAENFKINTTVPDCYFPLNFWRLMQGKAKGEAKHRSNRCVPVSPVCCSLTALPAAWAAFMQRAWLVTPSNSIAQI